jgi:hypothetical protein
MGDMRNAHKTLIGKNKMERLLGKPRRRWKITLNWILGK